MAVLEGLLRLQVTPEIIQQGSKINYLEVPQLKITFLNAENFVKGSVFELAAQFGLSFNHTFFPISWNQPELYKYEGKKPNLADFFWYSDSAADKAIKKTFHGTLPELFIAKDQLLATVRNESLLFAKACLLYLKNAFSLQNDLAKISGKETEAIHSFGWNIFSLSGFAYSVYRFYFMNDCDIYSVMKPYSSGITSSRGEYEWTTYENEKLYGDMILNEFNNFSGQTSFGKYHVDGYSPITKTVYQYYGCTFHYHDPNGKFYKIKEIKMQV